jgi:hypothetical protein
MCLSLLLRRSRMLLGGRASLGLLLCSGLGGSSVIRHG